MIVYRSDGDVWLSLTEASWKYRVSLRTVRDWLDKQKLDRRKLGNQRILVKEEQLREVLIRQRGYADPPAEAGTSEE